MANYTFGDLFDFEFSKIALPSGYTKLKYIENLGNASTYINTNYVANGNTKLRALVSINTTGYNSMGYVGTYRYGFNLTGSGVFAVVNTSHYYYTVTTSIGQKRLIEIDNISKTASLDGVVLGTITISYPIGGTYWIGRWNGYNAEYFNGKLFYHEFLENGAPIQKMIPCEDNNGNIGMYDTVTATFFANQGTSPFISGGEAPTPNYQNGDEIIISSTKKHYVYQDGDLVFWYQGTEQLVFRGFSFEQPDYWQTPESVFRGFSFEHENILRYYGVKIDVNGETERNYIPCIRTSDGIAGLYDTVNGVFYASAGANNFTT